MKHIISFSGGKDSTAMLLMMVEKGMPIDRIICVDTTKEFSAMYRHIKMLQEYIKPLKIEIIKIDFDYWFGEHVQTKGERKGQKGYGWADLKSRWCTRLKIEAIQKEIKEYSEVTEYIGIAFDESRRLKYQDKRKIKYPLIEWQITEEMALKYCYSKGFYWEGLYEKFNRVSCWCCPLQRISELRILYNDFPELWQELKEMDKKSFRKFRADYTIDQLERRFKEQEKQLCLEGI